MKTKFLVGFICAVNVLERLDYIRIIHAKCNILWRTHLFLTKGRHREDGTQKRSFTDELNWTFSFAQSKADPFAVTFHVKRMYFYLIKLFTHNFKYLSIQKPYYNKLNFVTICWERWYETKIWFEKNLNNLRCNVVN